MVALGGYEEDIRAVGFLVPGSHDLGSSLGFAIADVEGHWKYHLFSLDFSFLKLSNDSIILDGLCYILQFNILQLRRYEGSLALAKPWDSHLENQHSDLSKVKASSGISY